MQNTTKFFLLKTLFLIGGLLVPMLCIWVFIGELNLSHNNWLVASYGKKWGILSDGTVGFGINTGNPLIGWEPFITMLAVLIFITLVFVLMTKYKIFVIPFFSTLFATWFMLFMIIVTGLLYANPENSFEQTWKILVRLVCVAISFATGFFSVNFIIGKFMINAKWATEYVNNVIEQEKSSLNYIKENLQKQVRKDKVKKPRSIDMEDKHD